MTISRLISSAVLLAAGLLVASCGDKPTQQAGPPPEPTVTVGKPMIKAVTDSDEYVGRFAAVDYVEIRSRVSGYLESIMFQDGAMVEKGTPLFQIDKRPFQASLEQAKASRGTAQANVAFTQADLKRGESLVRGSTITQQTFDQRTQAGKVAQANLAAQDAAVQQAQLDFDFTTLTAPVSGRIGDRRVSIGNLVTGGTGGGTTLLATIASIDPIRFEFTMDEASYLRYLRDTTGSSSTQANRGISMPARLRLIDEPDFGHVGKLDFVDNAIDRSSGTIRGRAEFPNADGRLTPGMFGRVQIASKPAADALLVPDSAIGTEQVRKFVYVVGPDNVATPKYIETGNVVEGMRVVKSGLKGDEMIITNGVIRVRPGAKVKPQPAPSPPTAARETATRTN